MNHNLRKLIEHVESQPESALGMGAFVNECGTTLCLAGHAALLSGCTLEDRDGIPYFARDGRRAVPFYEAMRWLNIPYSVANNLFFVDGWPFVGDQTMDNVTKQDALEAMRRLESKL